MPCLIHPVLNEIRTEITRITIKTFFIKNIFRSKQAKMFVIPNVSEFFSALVLGSLNCFPVNQKMCIFFKNRDSTVLTSLLYDIPL